MPRRVLIRIFMNKKGFTLIELLIVIGIVAILATITLLVLNPVEMLRKARDGKRISELKTISDAINLSIAQIPPLNIGQNLYVYVSLPDSSLTCNNHNLPDLAGSGRTYRCADQANYRRTDGSGWIPVNFDSLPSKVLAILPIDPVNNNANQSGLYYTYAPGSWELNAKMESQKYQPGGQNDISLADGGDASALYEVGSNLDEIPVEINNRGATSTPADVISPTVSITIPASLATVSGTIPIGATASDNIGVAGVQFRINGVNLGSEDTTTSSYSTSWDTTLFSNGTHIITAVARDTSSNLTTSAGISVTVSNGGGGDTTPPVISALSSSSLTTKQITISWNTDEPADSQIDYGLTPGYGSQTTLDSAMVTSHSQTITGLTSNTLYHFRVRSRDAASNLANSTDNTFTTWPVPALTNPGFESCIGANAVIPNWISSAGTSTIGCLNTLVQSGSWRIYAVSNAYAYQILSLKQGIQYTFNTYAATSVVNSSSTLLISSVAGGGTSYCSTFTTSSAWTQLSCNYTPPSDMTVYFNLKGGPVSTGSRFDNATTSAN